MASFAAALPILPGKTDELRRFANEVHQTRRAEYDACQKRMEVTKESWHLQITPNGDLWIISLEAGDLAKAFGAFITSQEPFDRWFKEKVRELTGVNFNEPMGGPMSEVIGEYQG